MRLETHRKLRDQSNLKGYHEGYEKGYEAANRDLLHAFPDEFDSGMERERERIIGLLEELGADEQSSLGSLQWTKKIIDMIKDETKHG